jgi:hypothetical protein
MALCQPIRRFFSALKTILISIALWRAEKIDPVAPGGMRVKSRASGETACPA